MVDMIDMMEEIKELRKEVFDAEAAIDYLAESGAYIRVARFGNERRWWLENRHGLVQQDTHNSPMQAIKAAMLAAKGGRS